MTKLTNSFRDVIIANAIKRSPLAKQRDKLQVKLHATAERMRIHFLGGKKKAEELQLLHDKLRNLVNEHPSELRELFGYCSLQRYCGMRIIIGGQTHYVSFGEDDRGKSIYKVSLYRGTFAVDHALATKFVKLKNQHSELLAQIGNLRQEVKAAVYSVNTVKRLVEVWPERHDMLDLCVLLNGPPGVGKDTLADLLAKLGFQKYAFKTALYMKTAEHYKMDLERFVTLATDREQKEIPHPELALQGLPAVSPREALITVSEHIIKPMEGRGYFGEAAKWQCMQDMQRFAVFSDSGFTAEATPLYSIFHKVVVIQLHRKGFTFDGDSRGYLNDLPNTHKVNLIEGDIQTATEDMLYAIMAETCPWAALLK